MILACPQTWRYMHALEQRDMAAEVGRMFHFLKLDTRQIAHELGYPEATIYSALHCWRERRRQA